MYQRKAWRDGTVLNDMIKGYVGAAIDSDLLTAVERHKRGKKAHDKRGERPVPSSPAVPLKQKRRRGVDSEEAMRRQPKRGAKKKRSQPQPASSSASDDEFIEDQLIE